ncbi:MAG TPA: exosortase/archaeosortase family protein [Bryobacteraceae bacterium]|nr:exosortase/archaeosortase family protein [Bryobacteraceae bacterium]
MADNSAVLVDDSPKDAIRSYGAWIIAAWIGLLLFAAYFQTLRHVYGSWFNDALNMEHGIFVPFAAAYMVWMKKDELKQAKISPSWLGVLAVVVATLVFFLSTLAQWIWVSHVSFLGGLVGSIWAVCGFRMVLRLVYPLATLVLMVPPPSFIINRVTLDLQLLASRLGEVSLETLGFSVLREGNILEMVGEKLAVAEACSGIRSLMALIFLAVVYSYFFVPQKRLRAILFASVIPIAILCNAGRIVATGVVGQFNRELAHGMLHATFGYFGLALGALMLFGLHRLLLKIPFLERGRYA